MSYSFGWPAVLPRGPHKTLRKVTSADPWFEIYQLTDGIYSIVEPFHEEETISFLVLGSERAVLIDTGMGAGDIKAEVSHLTTLPVTVINTHWHYDHIGCNHQFKDVWVYDDDFEVGKIERGMTKEELADKFEAHKVCAPLPRGFDLANYEIRRSKVTRRLQHLEEVQLGGRSLVIHHTPGHSPGGICLYDTKDGILFTGDTYYPGTLFCIFERCVFADYLTSMTYLAGLVRSVNVIAPSHNESLCPKEEIYDALAGFQQVAAGTAPYTVKNGVRNSRFERCLLQYPDGR